MSEIISIFSQILFILFIISFPIIILNNNSKSKFYEFSLIDKLCINLIFLVNVLFFASILNINSKYNKANLQLNPCLNCDELKSGPIFKKFAGRTRRNSGVRSAIKRKRISRLKSKRKSEISTLLCHELKKLFSS